MAMRISFNGITIQKPGYYGDPKWTPYFMKYGPILQLLNKLGVHGNRPPR